MSLRFDDLLKEDLKTAEESVATVEGIIQPDDACNVQFTSVLFLIN